MKMSHKEDEQHRQNPQGVHHLPVSSHGRQSGHNSTPHAGIHVQGFATGQEYTQTQVSNTNEDVEMQDAEDMNDGLLFDGGKNPASLENSQHMDNPPRSSNKRYDHDNQQQYSPIQYQTDNTLSNQDNLSFPQRGGGGRNEILMNTVKRGSTHTDNDEMKRQSGGCQDSEESDDKWKPPTGDMSSPPSTEKNTFKDAGAIPKNNPGTNFQKSWKIFNITIEIITGGTHQILYRSSDIFVLPFVLQYLLQYRFEEVKKILKENLTQLESKIKDIRWSDQTLTILYYSRCHCVDDAESDMDDLITCIRNLAKDVNYIEHVKVTAILNLNETLKKYLQDGRIAVYKSEDEGKVYVVGIVDDPKVMTKLLKSKAEDTRTAATTWKKEFPLHSATEQKLLEVLNFQDYLQNLKINVTVEIDKHGQRIVIQGDSEAEVYDVIAKKQAFLDTLLRTNILVDDDLFHKFLQLERIQDKIHDICRQDRLSVVYLVPSECYKKVIVYTREGDENAVKTLQAIFKDIFAKKCYYLKKVGDLEPFSKSRSFLDFVTIHEGIDLISSVVEGSVVIATIKEIDFEISKLEQAFIKLHGNMHKEQGNLHAEQVIDMSQASSGREEKEESGEIEATSPEELQELKLCQKLKFSQYMKDYIPNLKLEVKDDRISFTGASRKTVKEKLKTFISGLHCEQMPKIHPNVLKFLDLPQIIDHMNSCLSNKELLCHWFVNVENHVLRIYAADKDTLDVVVNLFFTSVNIKEYSNTEDSKKIFAHEDMQKYLQKNKLYLDIDETDPEDVIIVGIDFALQEFLQQYEKIDLEIGMKRSMRQMSSEDHQEKLTITPDELQFFQKHKRNEWKKFLEKFHVNTEIDDHGTVLVCGSRRDVKDALRIFHGKLKPTRIKWSCEVIHPAEVKQKLERRTLPVVESNFKCSVKLETNNDYVQQQQLGQWVDLDKDKHCHVVLVHGNVYDVAADVMLVPTNEPPDISAEIFKKGGRTLWDDQKRHTIFKEIYVSSQSGNLPCQMVAYFPILEDKDGKTTQAEVRKCLKELFDAVEKANLQSLVIPVKIASTIPETTFLHWFSEAYNSFYSSFNSLKQIYLSLWCTLKNENLVQILDKALRRDLDFYDFRAMLEITASDKSVQRHADITINLVKGKLVDQKVDVIVNSCNRDLKLDKGAVSASINAYGGQAIQNECKQKWSNGIAFGQVIKTTAGNMDFKFVLHGSLPYWTPGAKFSSMLVQKLVFESLVITGKERFRSIAFPVFATGNLEYPWDEVAKVMIDTIRKYGRMNAGKTSVREVTIVLYEKDVKSVKAFENRKIQTEKIQFRIEDSEAAPLNILTSRSNNVRIQIIPLKDIRCHHCEAVVKFLTYQETEEIRKKDNRSPLIVKGIAVEQDGLGGCYLIKVFSDKDEKTFKEAANNAFNFADDERIASIAFCLRPELGNNFKVQATFIRDVVISRSKKRYLQHVKLIIPDREEFDLLVTKSLSKQEDETKTWFGKISDLKNYVFSGNKHQWKCVSNSDIVETPRLMITAVSENADNMELLKKELEDAVEGLMKEKAERLGVTIKQEKPVAGQKWFRSGYISPKDSSSSSVDPVSPNSDSSTKEKLKMSSMDKPEPFEEVKLNISPSFQKPYYKQQIQDMVKVKGLKFDDVTWEVTCSYENMICLNRQLKEKFKTANNVVMTETIKAHSSKNFVTDQSEGDFAHIIKMKINIMDYKMLKFFCPECQIFQGSPSYDKGSLSRMLYPGEIENALKDTVQSKLRHLETYNTQEVTMPEGKNIDDSKWAELKHEVNQISSEIFCYRSHDQKTLTLRSSQYEKLQTAKMKSEFVLGLKTLNQGRRHRVIATEAKYTKDDNEVPRGGKSDMVASSNFARSFSSSSSTWTSPSSLPPELTFISSDGMIVKVYVGNILDLKVECIVNAANETLSHGGGVADVISRAAGYQLQDESDDYIQQHGSLNVTECCTTSAGSLKYKCVIHAVGPRFYKYPNDRRGCADDLEKTVQNCFHEANKNSIQSIALPAISSGIFGVPKEICSQQYCAAVRNYCNMHGKSTSLKEIHFMDKDTGMIQLIQNEFKNHLILTQTDMPQSVSATPLPSRISNLSDHSLGKNADKENGSTHSKRNSGHGTKRQNSTDYKGTFSVDPKKFNRQFMTTTEFKVHVVQADITQLKVDVIICPQDEFCYGYGRIAKAIKKVGNEKYRRDVTKMGGINKCEVKKIEASPSTLPFKYVLHTVAPRWDKNAVKDNAKFMKDLGLTIRNILRHCSDSKNILTAAIPVLGVGADGHETPYVTYASILAGQITKESDSDRLKIKELYVVISEWSIASCIADQFDKEKIFVKLTSFQRTRRGQGKSGKDKQPTKSEEASFKEIGHENKSLNKLGTTVKGGNMDNCVICMDTPEDPRCLKCGHIFCHNCISQHFKINNPVCPTCGSIQGEMTGNQPPGTMTVTRNMLSLAGYPSFGRIEVNYHIPAGKQGPEHKTPGRYYDSINRTGYLPDNAKGQLVAKLLRVAFDRRLVFTIGDSRTTGKTGVVTWNDIHHKTNPKPYAEFGYPDPTYLDRVIDELAAKGVTKDDIKPDTVMY